MSSRKLFSNNITFVTVDSVDYSTGKIKTKWLNGEDGPELMIPHPYVGLQGEGIFVGLQPGTTLTVGVAEHNQHVVLGAVQSYNFSSDSVYQQDNTIDFIGSPKIEGGEMVIQGLGGGRLTFNKSGGFNLENPKGEGFYLSGDNTNRFLLRKSAPVEYTISHSGVFVSGIVRREIGNSDSGTGLLDKSYEIELEEIGWDVNKSISLFSGGKEQMRNPPLVEERNIIFEYDNDFFVSYLSKEIDLRQEGSAVLIDGSARRQRRNNILSLSLTSPNELIEKSSGTLVDFFGNILDINKKIISAPFETENNEEFLNYVFENMRHSVAYRMAINTRKGWGYRSVSGNKKDSLLKITNLNSGIPSLGDFSNNTRDRSKWEVNIDKEGLTVVNIPATSETGNVPRLVRYCTSSDLSVDESGNIDVDNPDRDLDETLKAFPNNKRQDIFLEQVGPGGIEVVGEQLPNRAKGKPTSWVDEEDDIRSSPNFIQVGTAFHDIRKTAKKVLEKDLNVSAYVFKTLSPGLEPNPSPDSAVPDPEAVSSEINVSVPDFNRPELLQKVYIQEEEVVVGSSFPVLKVKNKGIIKATDVKLWHLGQEYDYDLGEKYFIKDNSFSDDKNALLDSKLSDFEIKLNTSDSFPAVKGDKILISYYYKGALPNAGGRSVVLNLDGSLETSIGANTVDRVSWTLDTAGAVIARLGRDKQGRSAIIHADGYVAVEIGGWDYVGETGKDEVDTRFVGQDIDRKKSLPKDPYRFRGGKLVIRIRRPDSNNPGQPDDEENDNLVIIDETGITIKSAGELNLISKNTMNIESESNLCLNAKNIILYENTGMPRFIRRQANKPI